MTDMTERLDAIEARKNAAAPGPWTVADDPLSDSDWTERPLMSKSMTEVLAEHRPSRWRSFTNENEILRCCRQDFGNLSRKPARDDDAKTWAAFAAHQAEALAAAGFGDVVLAKAAAHGFNRARMDAESKLANAKAEALEEAVEAFPLETITAPDTAVVWLYNRARGLRGEP